MVSGVEGILTEQYIYSHENVFVWQNTLHSDYVQNKTVVYCYFYYLRLTIITRSLLNEVGINHEYLHRSITKCLSIELVLFIC